MPYANGMFGAPIGISQAEADVRAQELHSLAMGEGQVRLEQAQITLASQKQMMDLMKGLNTGPTAPGGPAGPANKQDAMSSLAGDKSDGLANSLDLMANLSMQSGLPAQAKDFAVSASTLRKNSVEIQKDKTASMITELNLVGSLMDNVHDQASWQKANAMYEIQTGKPTPYAKMPYSEELVNQLRTGIMSAKDRALASAAKARENSSEALTKEYQARIPLIKAQTRLAEERTIALKKAGAVTKIPKPSDIKSITDLMTKDFGASLMPEEARVIARPVAERMLEIMKSQSITQSQAAMKAYQEAKANGDFGGIRVRTPMGGTLEKPLELPKDKSKLKQNMYYKGKGAYEGKVMLWTGAAFVPVGKGPGEIDTGSDDPDDEEDTSDSGDDEAVNDPVGEARGDYVGAQ